MPTFEFHQVDAFSAAPFGGNPAAVVPFDTERWPDDGWLAEVAAENNLAETAFVGPGDADGVRRLRWFTPTVEVDLCGHATLATAHVLWETGRLARTDIATFESRSGRLLAAPDGHGWIELDFPALGAEAVEAPDGLLDALGVVDARTVARSRFDHLIEVATPAEVAAVTPDMARLTAVDTRGVIVTAAGGDGVDFVSRFFAPAVGVPEDPVTGSAHSVLAPFWAQRLGRSELSARQISRRGGRLRLACRGDRVGIAGQAVTVISGTLTA